jgi:hypothetical protein
MTKDDVRVLHDQLAELHRLDMIDGCTREIVEASWQISSTRFPNKKAKRSSIPGEPARRVRGT